MLVDDGEDDCSSSSRGSRSSSRKSFMQEYEGEDEDPNDTSVARNGSYMSQKQYFKLSVYPQHILKSLIGDQRKKEASLEHFVKM